MRARLLLVPVVCLCATLNAYAAGGEKIEAALSSNTDLEFKSRALRDVLTYCSELHDIKFDIDPAVDSKTKVKVYVYNTPLREALKKFLTPLNLEFVAEENRVLVRKIPKKSPMVQVGTPADKAIAP